MRSQTQLPKYVSLSNNGYRYKPYLGRVDGRIKWGKSCYLAPADAPMSEVWRAFEDMQGGPRNTVGWVLSLYADSDRFANLKEKTQNAYLKGMDAMKAMPVGKGTFGESQLEHVTKRTNKSYLDTYPSPIAANRHVAVLKAAWSWAEERHEIPPNPCTGVRLNVEKPRDRYVTDDDLLRVLSIAPAPLAQAMELAYLLRARLSEVLSLRVDDVTDDHVVLRRLKGSEGELTLMSERLREAVSDVRGGEFVVHRYSQSAFRSAWRRLQAKAKTMGVEAFTFHDLKAKGISDHKDNFGGHRSASMRKVYVRKLQEVAATC